MVPPCIIRLAHGGVPGPAAFDVLEVCRLEAGEEPVEVEILEEGVELVRPEVERRGDDHADVALDVVGVPALVEEGVAVEQHVIIVVVVETEMGGEGKGLHEQVGAGFFVGRELHPDGRGALGQQQGVRGHRMGPAADAALCLGFARAAVWIGRFRDEEVAEFLREMGGEAFAINDGVGRLEGGDRRDLEGEGLAHLAHALVIDEFPAWRRGAHGQRDEIRRQRGPGSGGGEGEGYGERQAEEDGFHVQRLIGSAVGAALCRDAKVAWLSNRGIKPLLQLRQ
jgi:hypothetical protein